LIITYLNFALLRLAPGDPTLFMFMSNDTTGMSAVEVRDMFDVRESHKGREGEQDVSVREYQREKLGLNDPIIVQYGRWLGKVLQGDFGRAMRSAELIGPEMATRVGVTIRLTAFSTLLSVLIGIVAGTLSATFQYSWFDNLMSFFTYIVISVPGYLIATWSIILFAITLHWFPAGGMYNPRTGGDFWDRLHHMMLPVLAMGISGSAGLIRWTRTSVLNVMRSDYVTVARSKGLAEGKLRSRHILRNALLPVVTIVGRMMPNIVGGSALYETAFAYPGVGQWAAVAAGQKDFSIMIAVITVTATIVIVSNLIVDVSYAFIDPRVTYT
jgi:peptide/nickel transport system permease protein